MTQRDLFWRTAGAALIGTGYVLTCAATEAAAGLLLLLAGKKAVLALRVERSRHRELPGAIRASRRARREEL